MNATFRLLAVALLLSISAFGQQGEKQRGRPQPQGGEQERGRPQPAQQSGGERGVGHGYIPPHAPPATRGPGMRRQPEPTPQAAPNRAAPPAPAAPPPQEQ